MSTTNEKCTKGLPTGVVLIKTIDTLTKGAIISPSTQTTKIPLAPITTAEYNKALTKINVNVTVSINAADNVTSLYIYANPQITGAHTKQLYIVYDYSDVIPTSLYPYTFSFEIDAASHGHTIKIVESYLCNEDPETSRGTETTVQPPIG
jgi:hypothetical protein